MFRVRGRYLKGVAHPGPEVQVWGDSGGAKNEVHEHEHEVKPAPIRYNLHSSCTVRMGVSRRSARREDSSPLCARTSLDDQVFNERGASSIGIAISADVVLISRRL